MNLPKCAGCGRLVAFLVRGELGGCCARAREQGYATERARSGLQEIGLSDIGDRAARSREDRPAIEESWDERH